MAVLSDAKYNTFFPITSETPLLWKVSRNVSIKPSEVWEIAFLGEKTSIVPPACQDLKKLCA